mmetsp:Transcript_8702/g.15673  ORF Transcript_8702/g.15673 Transcript_8702/m.15673 type:complete len:391 (+) Transcript_8702:105-1277(+)
MQLPHLLRAILGLLLCGGLVSGLRPSDLQEEVSHAMRLAPEALARGNMSAEEVLMKNWKVPRVYCHATDNLYSVLKTGSFYGTTKAMKINRITIKDIIDHDNDEDGGLDYFYKGKHEENGDDIGTVRGSEAWIAKFGIPKSVFEEAQTYFIRTGENGPPTHQFMSVATARLKYGTEEDLPKRKGRGGYAADVRGVLVFSGWGPDDTHEHHQTLQIHPPGVTQVGSKKLIKPYPYAPGALVKLKDLDLRAVIFDRADGLQDKYTKDAGPDDILSLIGRRGQTYWVDDGPDPTSDGSGMLMKSHYQAPKAYAVEKVDAETVLSTLAGDILDIVYGGHPTTDAPGYLSDGQEDPDYLGDSDGGPATMDVYAYVGQGSDVTNKADGLEVEVEID